MTKKKNTLLFIFIATLFNLIVTVFLLLIFIILSVFLFKENTVFVAPFCFIAAIALGIFIYQKVARFVIKKYELEYKLDPIFSKRTRK